MSAGPEKVAPLMSAAMIVVQTLVVMGVWHPRLLHEQKLGISLENAVCKDSYGWQCRE